MECLFCQRRNNHLHGSWHSHLRRCSCGALYHFRFPPVWPLPHRLIRSQWEPIKFPQVAKYYGYVGFLQMLFTRLRHGAAGSEIIEQARAGIEMCDLIRFRDDAAHERLLNNPVGELLKLFIEHAQNPAIEMKDLVDLPRFHAICDFASWGLSQIANEQMDTETSGYFGGDMHNFPRGGGEYGTKELLKVYARAAAGELPSPGRLAIRSKLRNMS